MTKITQKLTALTLFFTALTVNAAETKVTSKADIPVTAANAAHFSGEGTVTRYPQMPVANGKMSLALVEFKAGTRTDWHTHSVGQYLIITEGVGQIQEWGKPVQTVRKGDVVWFAPNVKHWHGATEHTPMSHLAVSEVAEPSVEWLEKVALPPAVEPKTPLSKQNSPLVAKQLDLVNIGIYTAQGDLTQLNQTFEQALTNGLTVSEIKEAISHLYAYVGAPRTLNAMNAFFKLVQEREKQGIKDNLGDNPTELNANTDYYTLGTEMLAQLTNAPTSRPIFDFAPALDYSIKANLYGYLFSRDNLSAVNRELTTIGALSGLGESVNGQLRSHLSVAKNLGFTPREFHQLIERVGQVQNEQAKANVEKFLKDVK